MPSPFDTVPLQFPPLSPPTDAWEWPRPPFAWHHETPPSDEAGQPCLVETIEGSQIEARLVSMDVAERSMKLRLRSDGRGVRLSFTRLRRLTLTTPLAPLPRRANEPVERVPAAVQERDYRLLPTEPAWPALVGRTAGHVQAAEGFYLFTPVDEERSLLRVFAPAATTTLCEFGRSAEEIAAARWIADPAQLLAAIEHQQRMAVRPLGQSLLELGFVTPVQLERALAAPPSDVPLGRRLVDAGLLTRTNLQTALAHKMGFPLVDLERFPIDPAALRKLTLRMATEMRTLPLLIDGTRLVVAVDRPSRIQKLKGLQAIAELTPVPVLASKMRILDALTRLARQDVWSTQVPGAMPFFASTTTTSAI
ncbi:MAG TPA: hypothetical protein VLU41_12150 [Ideonella sp.]|nr:hypothetical protein [Ideonella sp.]